jgi:hypothetical protein
MTSPRKNVLLWIHGGGQDPFAVVGLKKKKKETEETFTLYFFNVIDVCGYSPFED